jgi:hypothetical protein
LFDDYKQVEGANNDNIFYTVKEQLKNKYSTGSSVMTAINIFLDPELESYSRNVYTVTDFLSQVGGIFSLLSSLCGLIVGLYSERMIYYTVLSKCYTFDTDNLNKNEEQKQEMASARKLVYIADAARVSEEIKVGENHEFGESKAEKHTNKNSKNLNCVNYKF